MLNRFITLSLENRFLVLLLAGVLIGAGVHSAVSLPIDAFPDTTPTLIQVNTTAPALAPEEIEQQITSKVEQAVGGLPGLVMVRSISKFGLSQVTVIFEDGTDVYLARQLVNERLQVVELPAGIGKPEMGPVSTGLGEIYHYIVRGKGMTLRQLTTLHDWEIKPRLASVKGVAEVNTWGGKRTQYHVLVDPARLMRHDLTLDDLTAALRRNNLNVGGGHITLAGEMFLVHGIGLATNVPQLGSIVVAAKDGVPIHVRDVAEVKIGHRIRKGAVTAGGEGEVVLGLGFMLMGENSREMTSRLQKRMKEIRAKLPRNVEIRPVYERSDLVDQVIGTVKENLLEGALLVVAVLFVLLGNLRAGLIVALAIPLSMLLAAQGMLRFGIAGSLMSLGAIDFGLVVDSSVIMVENSVRHLAENQGRRSVMDVVRDAAIEVRKPTMFGELIIMIVYLPILTLEGIEGKLFRPMALTVIFALAGSLVLSLTLMPVLVTLLLKGRVRERENFLVRGAKWLYAPILRRAIQARRSVIAVAVVLLAGGMWLASRTGAQFIPRLSEMGIVVNTVRLAGVSLAESVRYGSRLEQVLLKKFPNEIANVWTRTGTPEVATDPMGIELSDTFITLEPRSKWKRARTQEDLTELMRTELAGLPGMRMIYTQPIEMRVNEMVAGIRADVGVKIFGDDLKELSARSAQVDALLRKVEGSADVYTEQVTGQPVLRVEMVREALARHGISSREVLEFVQAIGGLRVGEVREGLRRFDLLVRLAEPYRQDPSALDRILIPAAGGRRIPLGRLARIVQAEGPATIAREWQRRRIVVQCNVVGRDVSGFVEEVRRRIESEITLAPGYHVEYGGQFEHLIRARKRLVIVVPIALLLIFLLLHASTGSCADSLIIFTGAPFAALGGVVALWLCDMPFTISAGVGFVAVSGVAMLNGLVIVSTIKQRIAGGMPLNDAIETSSLLRLRPVLMTALVAGLGFLPMALNTGVGAEVQRPLATVVVGGVISDNLLTLLVLPALYATFRRQPAGTGSS